MPLCSYRDTVHPPFPFEIKWEEAYSSALYFSTLDMALTEIKLASTKKKGSRSKNQKDSNSGRIVLRNSTIAKLKELSKGEGNRETYDEIILRLIKSYKAVSQ
jgi:hypothetical protein